VGFLYLYKPRVLWLDRESLMPREIRLNELTAFLDGDVPVVSRDRLSGVWWCIARVGGRFQTVSCATRVNDERFDLRTRHHRQLQHHLIKGISEAS